MAAPTASDTQTGAGGEEARSPFANKWWIASAVLVAVIVAMFLALLVAPAAKPRPHAAGPGAPHTVAPGPAASSASVCGLTNTDDTVLSATPAGTHWRLVGSMAAPYDPDTAGPKSTHRETAMIHDQTGTMTSQSVDLGACYAPGPAGALYAAANFIATVSAPELRLPASRVLCAQGLGRDASIADQQRNPGNRDTGIQLAGFAFKDYTPGSTATIEFVVTTGRGGYALFPMTMVWQSGDWLVQLPVTGNPFDGTKTIPDLAGYHAWAGA